VCVCVCVCVSWWRIGKDKALELTVHDHSAVNVATLDKSFARSEVGKVTARHGSRRK